MITRQVRIKVAVFIVVAVLGITYAGVRYIGLGDLIGRGGYLVAADLAESGGIFENAEVTYRGVPIGQVERLELRPEGMRAYLRIEHGTPPIPADTQAAVTNLSAVGEQYVDLRPTDSNGPYLHDGSVISEHRTSTPVRIDQLLTRADALTRSVPLDDLTTVVNELGAAFSGSGPSLRRLLKSGQDFTRAAVDARDPTLALIRDARTVLQTQNEQAPQIRSFAADLRLLAGQLRDSDPDIRRLIRTAPELAREGHQVLANTGTDLERLVANMLTTSKLLAPRQAGLQQVLTALPAVSAGSFSVVPPDGWGNIQLDASSFDPPICTRGYEDAIRRPGSFTGNITANFDLYCAERSPSPIAVRGASNAPYYGPPPKPAMPGGFWPSGPTLLDGTSGRGLPGLAGASGIRGWPMTVAGPLRR